MARSGEAPKSASAAPLSRPPRPRHPRKKRRFGLWRYEQAAFARGFSRVVGVDEAGRGPWAGPIVAAAVILPPFLRLPGINDSKLLAPEQRDFYYARLQRTALAIGVGIVEVAELDRVGVGCANRWAMLIALHNLGHSFDYLLVDGFPLPERLSPQEHIIDGDRLSISVMAAGIVAKVTRDGLMMRYEERFPGWGFGQHKGYGTPEHQEAIARLGLSPLHRRSFFPVQLAGLSESIPG